MMWHWLVSALAIGAHDRAVRRVAGPSELVAAVRPGRRSGVTLFGTSARFLDAIEKAGLDAQRRHTVWLDASARSRRPGRRCRRRRSTTCTSRSSPMSISRPSPAARTSSVVSCWAIRMGRSGAARSRRPGSAWTSASSTSTAGRSRTMPGELVCATPFPSMPLGFWNDPGDAKYRATYFERFPGRLVSRRLDSDDRAWRVRHQRAVGRDAEARGRADRHGGDLSAGRSTFPRSSRASPLDSTGRVTSVSCCSCGSRPGSCWTTTLRRRIAERIRTHASPRHVPARIVAVADIPRTKSGKLVEMAVRRVDSWAAGRQPRSDRQSRGTRSLPRPAGARVVIAGGALRLPTAVRRAIVQHALRATPLECCGFLVGTRGRVIFAVPMDNVAASPVRYRIDDRAHIDLRRVLRGVRAVAVDPGRLPLTPGWRGASVGDGYSRGAVPRVGACHCGPRSQTAERARVPDSSAAASARPPALSRLPRV